MPPKKKQTSQNILATLWNNKLLEKICQTSSLFRVQKVGPGHRLLSAAVSQWSQSAGGNGVDLRSWAWLPPALRKRLLPAQCYCFWPVGLAWRWRQNRLWIHGTLVSLWHGIRWKLCYPAYSINRQFPLLMDASEQSFYYRSIKYLIWSRTHAV